MIEPCLQTHFGILGISKGLDHAVEAKLEGFLLQENFQGQIAERDAALSETKKQLDELKSEEAKEKVCGYCKPFAVQQRIILVLATASCLDALAPLQEKHILEMTQLKEQMQSKEEGWKLEKARMDSIAREADRKHQQLADRTALVCF